MNRRNVIKDILWVLATVGVVAGLIRLARGLGATTNLDDGTPWGFWIGFDVIAGVALAAGGFTLAATVYIFHLEKYRPVLRPAILTAFLGYLAVIVGLIADIGLPWNIWRPMVNWQIHSVLFEVAWCVMLYTAVLALEFLPTALEHPRFNGPTFRSALHWLKRLTLPFVVVGIALSTLHQSSLGSLLLIMPVRVHSLYYSPILPVLFFISASALGLMMVTLEGFFTAYVYRHQVKIDLFASLGRAAAFLLWLFFVLRVGDLALRGVLPRALDGSWQSWLFLAEISTSTIVPAILLSLPKARASFAGLATASGLTVFGMVLHRLSASVIAVERPTGATYFPSWMEIAISLGIFAAIILLFLFFAENLKVFGPELMHEDEKPSPYDRPRFHSLTKIHQTGALWDVVGRRSAFTMIAVAFAIVMVPQRAWTANQTESTPVASVQGLTKFIIDGNRSGTFASFDHKKHEERQSKLIPTRYATEQAMCVRCHHLSKWEIDDTVKAKTASLADGQTIGGLPSCRECHSDMYQPTLVFKHDYHVAILEPGGNAVCDTCHSGGHSASTAKACSDCHKNMGSSPDGEPFNYFAPSYVDAMHGLCIECHKAEAEKVDKPQLATCINCHHLD